MVNEDGNTQVVDYTQYAPNPLPFKIPKQSEGTSKEDSRKTPDENMGLHPKLNAKPLIANFPNVEEIVNSVEQSP